MYVKQVHRILGDKNYLLGKYDSAIDHYFSSDLTFEEVMRLLYNLYKQNNQVNFALQMLKYFKILLGKFETTEKSRSFG
jgi:hypothetical protein